MAKLRPNDARIHRDFLRRQQTYEARYYPKYYAYLTLVYNSAAKVIRAKGIDFYLSNMASLLYEDKLIRIYKQLYREITIKEAVIQKNELKDQINGTKDIIDDIVSFGNGDTIGLWRSLINSYIQVRLTGRITEVNRTTEKAITLIIEKGIAEGEGALEVAKRIRKETGFNQNRALAIARTETITASNQGKYIAAQASPIVLQKNWVPTNDSRTRPTHAAMSDHPWIDMDQYFMLDSRKRGIEPGRFPCDSTYSAENVINCRCSVVFRAKTDENGNIMQRI